MLRTPPSLLVLLAALLLCSFAPVPKAPQEGLSASSGGVIPVQVVAGRLVASCDLSTAANRIPANLFIEFEAGHGLQLHNRAAAGLRAESPDGKALPITIHFPDFGITVPKRELGDEDLFEDFTKYNSVEIGENALVGSIGAEILKDWKVEFALASGEVRLAPLEALEGAPRTSVSTDPDGTVHTPITIVNDRVWLPVRRPDGTPGAMMVGCAEADTVVDLAWADGLGKPAGDVGPIKVGPLDLHTFVAFRPEPLVEVHPDGVVGQVGINLLQSIDLEIDRAKRTARLRVAKPAQFPEGDLAFFRARAEEDSEPVAQFLEDYPDNRLAHEASKLLLDLYIDEGAGTEQLQAAVDWLGKTILEDLRTTRMLDLMKEMANAGETEVVLAAGRLGVDSGRDDRYPNAVHHVHGLLGKTYLDRLVKTGENQSEAWSHLLSAAFGLPEEGTINLNLGRFYEYQKRYNRAYSRFIQAVIQPDSGPEALEALQRVQPLLESGEAFSVDTIERMIAGKVRNFGAATRYVSTDEEPADKVVLVEFFTNCHQGDERGGAIGGALGNEGLIQHFPSEHVVFLSHHLPKPQVDPLCTSFAQARANHLGLEDPGVHVIDGVASAPGAARWRQAEGVYQRARGAIIGRLATYTDYDLEDRRPHRARRRHLAGEGPRQRLRPRGIRHGGAGGARRKGCARPRQEHRGGAPGRGARGVDRQRGRRRIRTHQRGRRPDAHRLRSHPGGHHGRQRSLSGPTGSGRGGHHRALFQPNRPAPGARDRLPVPHRHRRSARRGARDPRTAQGAAIAWNDPRIFKTAWTNSGGGLARTFSA